jgi:ubiquinone/menaquinone biosynthesis C-methylase UbiE/heme-degrading monooxygenase HmoA
MILETAVLTIKPGQEADFEVAMKMAKPLIARSQGFRGIEVRPNLDCPGQYLLLVSWDNVGDHEDGFRKSERYGRWKELLHHFYDPFPTVDHFGESFMPGTTAIYDRIGIGYDTSRVPDPRIADTLIDLIAPEPGDSILDIACGTANYTGLLADRGLNMTGLDLSATMLARAREKNPALPLIRASVEDIPLPDNSFDHVMCTLAIHHFPDLQNAFAEVARVLRGDRFVTFTATSEQTAGYWLGHYFPNATKRAVETDPSVEAIETALSEAGFKHHEFVNWEVPENLLDRFAYSGKDNPELYFEEGILDGISLFANLGHKDEIEAGLKALRADIDSGKWQDVRDQYDHDLGDYCFVIAHK